MTAQQRRVLANLSLPRSLNELARVIAADAHAEFGRASFAALSNEVAAVLRALDDDDLVVNLGVVEDAEAAIDAAMLNGPPMPPEKAAQYRDRMSGKDAYKLTEGELWYWTAAGHEQLRNS